MKKIKALWKFYSFVMKANKLSRWYNTRIVLVYKGRLYLTTPDGAVRDGVHPFDYYYETGWGKFLKRTYCDKFVKDYINGRFQDTTKSK